MLLAHGPVGGDARRLDVREDRVNPVKGRIPCDLPPNFHPGKTRVRGFDTPCNVGRATEQDAETEGIGAAWSVAGVQVDRSLAANAAGAR